MASAIKCSGMELYFENQSPLTLVYKEMLFVGTSDETGEIAYIYFYDSDLDSVSRGAAALLRECTGWDKVMGK